MPQALRIVVIAPDPAAALPPDEATQRQLERSRSLRIGLLESGFNLVASLPPDAQLGERLSALQPDLLIVDAQSDAHEALAPVIAATREGRRPIVMFSDDDDPEHMRTAIAAGVAAYIVTGLAPARIRPILDVAMARFQHEESLRHTVAALKTELEDRKLVDRAKGLLMNRRGLAEAEAYAQLRKAAMDRGMKLADVARHLIEAAHLLG